MIPFASGIQIAGKSPQLVPELKAIQISNVLELNLTSEVLDLLVEQRYENHGQNQICTKGSR
jgi:hypothetical protein